MQAFALPRVLSARSQCVVAVDSAFQFDGSSVANCRTPSGVDRDVSPFDDAINIKVDAVEVGAESGCDGRAGRSCPSIARDESLRVFDPLRRWRRKPDADNDGDNRVAGLD